MSIGRFFAGIFVITWSPKYERYLVLQRSAERDHAAGVWECVTGRVDQGEGFEDALHREVLEEIGVDVRFEFIVGTLHFYRGPKTPEYEMLGLACFCTLDEPERIQVSPEHADHRWVNLEEIESLYEKEGKAALWIRNVIRKAEAMRQAVPPEFAALTRGEGPDIQLAA